MNLPESALPVCAYCAKKINPDGPTGNLMARQIIGYSIPRTRGGQNHVVGRLETGRYLCPDCTSSLKAGNPGQAVIA